jgi:integrase
MKGKVRVLRPSEYRLIREVAKREKQILLDSLLLTGMRYEELVRLRRNEDWLSGKFIYLPEWAEKKAKRKQKERVINLSIMGRSILPQLFQINVPSRSALDKWLHYNFLLIEGLSAKTLRKTYGSWLLSLHPERLMDIALSQGHDELTELNHYMKNGFEDRDRMEMKEWIEGWI